MSDQNVSLSLKKTFFYNFFTSNDEEEVVTTNNIPWVVTRELIEIKDIHPAPKIDLEDPWQIKKKITYDEVVTGKLVIPFVEMFEYILRHWILDMAKSMENRCGVPIDMWDVTEENVPKKYEGGGVCLRKQYNDDFTVSCIELFNDHGLRDGYEIGMYWDPRSSSLMFKLFSAARA